MPAETSDPRQVLTLLMNAIRDRDGRSFETVCRTHQEIIASHFAVWSTVPEEIRGNDALVQLYATTMITTAQFFDQELHRPDLLKRLMGPKDGDNPIQEWIEGLRQAQSLIKQLQYDEAIRLLLALLEKVTGLRGSAVDDYLPVTYGYLAQCYFNNCQAEMALAPAQRALELCEKKGDITGVHAYLDTLYESHRYLGNGEQAADFARRLSKMFESQGKQAEAARFARQARIVQAGEPPSRIVIDTDGQQFELDETLPLREGRVRFNFVRNRISLAPALALISRGEQLANEGKYSDALSAFQEAAHADPYDPQPKYLEGLTLLHLKRYEEAIASYAAVEMLAPGWFNCRTDLWLARQLAEGNITHEMFLTVLQLEDDPADPATKLRIAQRALAEKPGLAPLYLYYGESLAALHKEQDAVAAYRRGLECVEEPAIESRLLVRLASLAASQAEKIRLFERAIALNGHLTSTAMAMVSLAGLKG